MTAFRAALISAGRPVRRAARSAATARRQARILAAAAALALPVCRAAGAELRVSVPGVPAAFSTLFSAAAWDCGWAVAGRCRC